MLSSAVHWSASNLNQFVSSSFNWSCIIFPFLDRATKKRLLSVQDDNILCWQWILTSKWGLKDAHNSGLGPKNCTRKHARNVETEV